MSPTDAALYQTIAAGATAVATVVLVGITAAYVRLTHGLATTASRQTFDSMFFQLRSSLDNTASHLTATVGGNVVIGRQAFESAAGLIVGELLNAPALPTDDEGLRMEIDALYKRTCQTAGADFGHYFRRLFYLLKVIDESSLPPADKYGYAAIIRGDLSTGELALLAYNCISLLGKGRFKALVERYSLLAGMRYPHDIVRQHVLQFFERSAISSG